MKRSHENNNHSSNKFTYYVAECMEFLGYGEYHENIQTLEEALRIYKKIPPERLNAIKGIGVIIDDFDYGVMYGRCVQMDLLKLYPEAYEILFQTTKELTLLMPDIEVFGDQETLKKLKGE